MIYYNSFDRMKTIYKEMERLKTLPKDFGSGWSVFSSISNPFIDEYTPIDLYIPDNINKIAKGAFCNCWNIRTLRLPMPAANLAPGAFECCYFLEKIIVPKGRKEEYEAYFYQEPFYMKQFCVVEEGDENGGHIDPTIVEKLHYKLIVSVSFDKKTYDYTSVYNVKLGDEVYVEGNMAGEKGIVTRIKGELPSSNKIFYKTILLAKRGQPVAKKAYTEKEQSKAKEKIITAIKERKSNAISVFKNNIIYGLQDEKELFLLALPLDGSLIRYGGEQILRDKQLMILALKNTTDDLFRTTNYFIEDKEIVYLQLERHYESFRELSDQLKADEDVRIKLIESGAPYEFASEYIKQEEFTYRLVETYVRVKGYNLSHFKDYYNNRELWKIAVTNSREILFESWVPVWVKKDPEICYWAIAKGNITMLPAVDERLRNNPIFIAAILSVKPKAASYWKDEALLTEAKQLGKISMKEYLSKVGELYYE